MCTKFNARAYITINKRNYKDVTFNMLKKLSDKLLAQEYKCANLFNSVCGSTNSAKEKRWVIDVDCEDESFLSKVIEAIERSQSKYNIVTICNLPTVNGFHLITYPFNLKEVEPFLCVNPVEVRKDSFTLLYYNDGK